MKSDDRSFLIYRSKLELSGKQYVFDLAGGSLYKRLKPQFFCKGGGIILRNSYADIGFIKAVIVNEYNEKYLTTMASRENGE